jgi:hypothetical protein
MQKRGWMLWVILIAMLFAVMSGGCGGGGGDDSLPPSAYIPPEPPLEPAPEIPEGWDEDAYYEPTPWTQEELDELYNEGYVEGTYDDLKLPDGTYVKDLIETLSQEGITGARGAGNVAAPRAARNLTAFEYIALMNKRAWDLTLDFPADDPKRNPSTHEDGRSFGQVKYVYVYEQYPGYVGACDDLIKQNERKYLTDEDGKYISDDNGKKIIIPPYSCEDGMYAMDCVGFVFESARAAGIPMIIRGNYVTRPDGVKGLANTALWNGWLEEIGNNSVAVESVSTAGEPMPGDILVWLNLHVALAATLGNDTILLHSAGKMTPPYTCEDYEAVAPGHRQNDDASFSNVSGPQHGLYSTWIKKNGRESYRLRIKDKNAITSGKWIDVADTSWYNPYDPTLEIETAEELAGLAYLSSASNFQRVNFTGKTITIISDIDLAGKEWTPIGDFSGILEANGHSIRNMKVTNGKGLFSAVSTKPGLISQLHLVDVDVSGNNNVGGLAGAINDATVQLCSVSGSVKGSSGVGMVVGGNYGTVFQCTASSGEVSGSGRFIGGVVGSNYARVINNKSYATVKGNSAVGGIAGENYTANGYLENNEAYGSVSGTGSVGGVIGLHNSQSTVLGNKFSKSTGQTNGIGSDGKNGGKSSNQGCEYIN